MIITVRAPADVHPRDVRTCGPLDTHRPCLTVVVYPRSTLISINGLLWRSEYALFCAERLYLEVVKRFILELYGDKIRLEAIFHVFTTCPQCYILRPVGLAAVPLIQRRFRRPGRPGTRHGPPREAGRRVNPTGPGRGLAPAPLHLKILCGRLLLKRSRRERASNEYFHEST